MTIMRPPPSALIPHKRRLIRSCVFHIASLTAIYVALALTVPIASEAQVDPPTPPKKLTVSINLIDSPEIVFTWIRDRCEKIDIPDAPARAFRDASGTVHLISSHFTTREMVGTDLNNLRHICNVAYNSALDDRVDSFQDHEWIASTYTLDGKVVYGLVHNEYQGHLRPALCASRSYIRCWNNQITRAISSDGGFTFARIQAPDNLVAMPPYRYEGDSGHPVGYFNPTNIVKRGDYYYTLFRTTEFHAQRGGVCIMRTANLADPKSWRAWNGFDFNVKFVEPYRNSINDDTSHVCAPIKSGKLVDVGGIAQDEFTKSYLLVMKGAIQINPKETASGIWITASYNLIDWCEPVLLWPDPSGTRTWAGTLDAYPSLLDPTSTSRNFETIHDSPYIYFVRFDPRERPYGRQLLRQRVLIHIAAQNSRPGEN